jgi:hypothetical protein
MINIQDALNALRDARAALNERRRATKDAQEEATLAKEVDSINVAIARLALDDLAAASQRVSDAADGVEALLRTAKVKPFDRGLDATLKAVADAAIKLGDVASKAFTFDAPPALDRPDADDDIDVAAPAPARAAAAGGAPPPPGNGLPPIVSGRKFAELAEDYRLCWDACAIRSDRREEVGAPPIGCSEAKRGIAR